MIENVKPKDLHKTPKQSPYSHFKTTFSDYKKEFLYPDIGLSFHICDNWTGYMHTHNYYEFFIVTKGKLKHVINNQTQQLSCGTIYFITPSDKHIILPAKGYESQHINIAVTSEKLKSLCELIDDRIFPLLHEKSFTFALEETDFAFFTSQSDKLSILYSHANNEAANQLYILEMLTVAISCTYRKLFCLKQSLPTWFNDLLNDLSGMDFSELTPAVVYEKANYSPAAIVKYFKEYLNKTIVSYIAELKIQRACALLTNTNYKIITISGAAGFDTLQSFNRTFKKIIGTTPTEYRESQQKI